MGPMDEWRYKIVGHVPAWLDEETEAWTPALTMESDIFTSLDIIREALEHLKDHYPTANFKIMRTRDKWEVYHG